MTYIKSLRTRSFLTLRRLRASLQRRSTSRRIAELSALQIAIEDPVFANGLVLLCQKFEFDGGPSDRPGAPRGLIRCARCGRINSGLELMRGSVPQVTLLKMTSRRGLPTRSRL